MADIRTTTSAPGDVTAEAPQPPHVEIHREDYRPPDWLVPEIGLRFTLGLDKTRVQSKLLVQRNPAAGAESNVIRLNGDELHPLGVWVDGAPTDKWTMDGGDL